MGATGRGLGGGRARRPKNGRRRSGDGGGRRRQRGGSEVGWARLWVGLGRGRVERVCPIGLWGLGWSAHSSVCVCDVRMGKAEAERGSAVQEGAIRTQWERRLESQAQGFLQQVNERLEQKGRR
jgi:hypothetical protein